jgi:hypothetical protein
MCIYYRDVLECGCVDEGVIPCGLSTADLPEIDGVDWNSDGFRPCEGIVRHTRRDFPPCPRHRAQFAASARATADASMLIGDAMRVRITLGADRAFTAIPFHDAVGLTVRGLVGRAVAALADAPPAADDAATHAALMAAPTERMGLDFLELGACVEWLGAELEQLGELRLVDLALGRIVPNAVVAQGRFARMTLRELSALTWRQLMLAATEATGETLLVPPWIHGPCDVTLEQLVFIMLRELGETPPATLVEFFGPPPAAAASQPHHSPPPPPPLSSSASSGTDPSANGNQFSTSESSTPQSSTSQSSTSQSSTAPSSQSSLSNAKPPGAYTSSSSNSPPASLLAEPSSGGSSPLLWAEPIPFSPPNSLL